MFFKILLPNINKQFDKSFIEFVWLFIELNDI